MKGASRQLVPSDSGVDGPRLIVEVKIIYNAKLSVGACIARFLKNVAFVNINI